LLGVIVSAIRAFTKLILTQCQFSLAQQKVLLGGLNVYTALKEMRLRFSFCSNSGRRGMCVLVLGWWLEILT
jgi:hypothetical protein